MIIPTNTVVRFIVGTASVGSMTSMMLQAVPVVPESSFVEQVSRLGMVGLLAVAVVVLWRKLQDKDAILMTNYQLMANALAANRVVVEKMAETLERIEGAVDKLDNVRQMVKP